MQIEYYYPGRPPSDPNMNNNNNNNSGEETNHGNQIDQGTDEGLDEDAESYNSPDSIIDSNNDGIGLGTGTESDSNGLGSGTDSSTSDDNNTTNEADIDTDEVSTDESQHGDQDEHQALEGAIGGVPMATTPETNVLACGDLGTPGLSSKTTGDSQNGRISRLPARKKMLDGQILKLLPPSQPTDGNATALTKCNADGCSATGIPDCQGYCTEHFCNLFRQGKLDIPQRFEDEIQRGQDSGLYEPIMDTPQGQECFQNNRDRSSSQGHYKRHRKTKCKSSMCNCAARETGYCGKCSRTNQLCAKPKEKYRCQFKGCSKKSNSKRGLCRSCNSILETENAKRVQLPKPEFQRAKCTCSSSSSDENSKENRQSRNRRDRHAERNEQFVGSNPQFVGSNPRNRDIGIGAKRKPHALHCNEDQHTRQNSARYRDYNEGRGNRCCEPHYESGAPPYHYNDMHSEPRHIRESRQREPQYGASPQQQRNNMHCEMRQYAHTGGRHTENRTVDQLGYSFEESLQMRYSIEESLQDDYEPLPSRNEPRTEHSEDHERLRDNRQLNTRREFIPVNDRTPPESIIYSPESSYYDNGDSEMVQRPYQGLARRDISPRNPGGDREVTCMQRNTSDSDLESTTSSFVPTYSESGQNHLRKCRRAECDNYGNISYLGYCNACYRQ